MPQCVLECVVIVWGIHRLHVFQLSKYTCYAYIWGCIGASLVTVIIYNLVIECTMIPTSLSGRAKLTYNKNYIGNEKLGEMTLEDQSSSSKLGTNEIARSFNV